MKAPNAHGSIGEKDMAYEVCGLSGGTGIPALDNVANAMFGSCDETFIKAQTHAMGYLATRALQEVPEFTGHVARLAETTGAQFSNQAAQRDNGEIAVGSST